MPGAIKLPITQGATSSISNEWVRPIDWLDMTTEDNEINLLVMDDCEGYAFAVNTVSGTYIIDWGDGNVSLDCVSGTTYQHQYVLGAGTPCSLGYTTFKIRIYGATSSITRFQVKPHTWMIYDSNYIQQYHNILAANFGTTGITSYSNTFYAAGTVRCSNLKEVVIRSFSSCQSTSDMFTLCYSLQSVTLPLSWGDNGSCSYMFNGCSSLTSINLPPSWGIVANCDSMFSGCRSLISINLPSLWSSVSTCNSMFSGCILLTSVNLPSSWDSVISCYSMFSQCNSIGSINLPPSWDSMTVCYSMLSQCSNLKYVTIPSSWGGITNCNGMFSGCYTLQSVNLPPSWGIVTNCSRLFSSCSSLVSINLPSSWGNITDCNAMFDGCASLLRVVLPSSSNNITNALGMFVRCNSLSITNLEYLGSTVSICDMTNIMQYFGKPQGYIAISAKLKAIGIMNSGVSYRLPITAIRLTNTTSPFTGTSPQINVQYTTLSATALNDLFSDLPVLTGKTIKITGCTGAATCDTSIATAKGWTVTN